jgi:hypothetical protein
MHDKLSARLQSLVGDRVHVPDDDVGPVARLDECVRAAVDTDEDRAILAEIRPQRSEVFAVVVTANDDQDVLVLDLGEDLRNTDAVEKQVALAPHILHGVGDERLELGRQPGPGFIHRRDNGLLRLENAVGKRHLVPVEHRRVEPQPLSVDHS